MGCGDSKRSIIAGLNSQVDYVKGLNLKFQQEIDQVKKDHEKQEAEHLLIIKNFNDENQASIDKKSRLEIQLRNLDPKADIVRTKLHGIEAELKLTRKEIKQLEKELKSAENEKKSIENDYKNISHEVNNLLHTEKQLEEKIENLGDSEAQIIEFNSDGDRLGQEIKEKEKIIEDLEENIRKKQAENKEKEDLKKQIEEVLGSTQNTLMELQAVKDEIHENEEIQKEADTKINENQELEKNIQATEITQNEISAELELDKEIERLTNLINEANETNEKRRNLSNKLQEVLSAQNEYNSTKVGIEKEINEIQEEIDRRKREKEESLNAKLNSSINELNGKITEHNINYENEMKKLQEEMGKKEEKCKHRREKRDKEQKEVDKLKRELEEVLNSPEIVQVVEETKEPQTIPEPAEAEPEPVQAEPEPVQAQPEVPPTQTIVEDSPQLVRYEIPIKLRHVLTGWTLHSHSINYVTGSKQQEVTCYEGRDDNDWWVIRAIPPKKGEKVKGGRFRVGAEIPNNTKFTLMHLTTKKNLHSHSGFPSPATHQQEVSCYGHFGVGDNNDFWKLEIPGGQPNEPWMSNMRVRLIHFATNFALHSHGGHQTQSWQQEVTGYQSRDDNDLWTIERIA